jgi:hypothetical protein
LGGRTLTWVAVAAASQEEERMKPRHVATSLALIALVAPRVGAADPPMERSAYMGGPVELTKAPNGAITNKRLLDRVGDFTWLEPTIENPAKGIWVFGG